MIDPATFPDLEHLLVVYSITGNISSGAQFEESIWVMRVEMMHLAKSQEFS